MENEHVGEIEESFTESEAISSCSCGWRGNFQKTYTAASDELQEHRKETLKSEGA